MPLSTIFSDILCFLEEEEEEEEEEESCIPSKITDLPHTKFNFTIKLC